MAIKTQSNFHENQYENKIHTIGRITLIMGLILSFLPPIILWLVYDIIPPVNSLLNGIISISSVMIAVSIVEVLTFAPILGSSAMYMSYLTGNILNMKIPCAAISMEVAEVKPSTKEGDIIATIAIAGSVIASQVIIILGVIMIVPITAKLNNPIIQPAFEQILPALFGSIGAYYILKEWKLAVAPLSIAVLLSFIPNLPTAITIPIGVGTAIIAAKYLYKRNMLKTID
ncbi:hypothetical protein [Alkaliphilus peptidifermentans]|uniref:Uncharacterized protein n=1 Tax=Alkaliphilus peptidifermentans DSM 18978 TaxID=1120976 RepID=A0A1G5J272_9FIRM|nr:hypothetical protein [Alkaliphilus peptidifermentans]SCY81778.1 hypothetical protein SAMN03080606_02593 [Alkaliphilus peptidifermentans DSM 18978]